MANAIPLSTYRFNAPEVQDALDVMEVGGLYTSLRVQTLQHGGFPQGYAQQDMHVHVEYVQVVRTIKPKPNRPDAGSPSVGKTA